MTDLPQMAAALPQVLERLLAREDLESALVERTFGQILDGQLSAAQVAALAIALRAKGETDEEIAAACRALRSRARMIRPRVTGPLLDTCGTGGDGAHTINVSTMSAIIVAACGVTVAKHGNRAISSRAGSADVIEALGVPIEPPPPHTEEDFDVRLGRSMEEIGIAFLFAPRHHGALRHAAAVRRELGVRTVFNLLGPIANPAGATHQLIGVFDDKRRRTLASVLGLLGTRRAWLVHGTPCEGAPRGLDEVSPNGVTKVTELGEDGSLTEREIHPSDAGLEPVALSAIAGGSAQDNARAVDAILAGERSGARTAVVLNAACALVVAQGGDLRTARERAEAALDRGDARETLARWRRFMT